jgi:hypothetical protein
MMIGSRGFTGRRATTLPDSASDTTRHEVRQAEHPSSNGIKQRIMINAKLYIMPIAFLREYIPSGTRVKSEMA